MSQDNGARHAEPGERFVDQIGLGFGGPNGAARPLTMTVARAVEHDDPVAFSGHVNKTARPRRTEKRRNVFGRIGRAIFRAASKFLRRRATSAGDKRTHLVKAGVQHLMGAVKAATTSDPPASREGSAPH